MASASATLSLPKARQGLVGGMLPKTVDGADEALLEGTKWVPRIGGRK